MEMIGKLGLGTKLVGQSSDRDRVNCRQFVALRPSLYCFENFEPLGWPSATRWRSIRRDFNLVFIVSISTRPYGYESFPSNSSFSPTGKSKKLGSTFVETISRFFFSSQRTALPTNYLDYTSIDTNWPAWFDHNVNRDKRLLSIFATVRRHFVNLSSRFNYRANN